MKCIRRANELQPSSQRGEVVVRKPEQEEGQTPKLLKGAGTWSGAGGMLQVPGERKWSHNPECLPVTFLGKRSLGDKWADLSTFMNCQGLLSQIAILTSLIRTSPYCKRGWFHPQTDGLLRRKANNVETPNALSLIKVLLTFVP